MISVMFCYDNLLSILSGVTQVEGDEIILTVYGQNIVTEDKYSSDTEPFHWSGCFFMNEP